MKGRIRHPEDNEEDYLHDLGGMQRFLKQGRKHSFKIYIQKLEGTEIKTCSSQES